MSCISRFEHFFLQVWAKLQEVNRLLKKR